MTWASGDATFEVVIALNKALYILVAISLTHIKQYVTVRGALMANNFVTTFSLKKVTLEFHLRAGFQS